MARRTRGEGSVYQDKQGQWWAKVPLGDGTTRRARCDSRASAEKTRKRFIAERDSGVNLKASQQAFADWAAQCLAGKKTTVKPRTLEFYERHLGYAIPHIGTLKMENLEPHHIRATLAALSEGLAPRSVFHVRRVLGMVCEMAVRDGVIARNPVKAVDAPRVQDYAAHVLSEDEIVKILAAVDGTRRKVTNANAKNRGEYGTGEPDRIAALMHIALTLGLRRGEMLNLKWTDYDPIARTLAIRDGKSPAASRVLPLTDALCARLDAHKAQQALERTIQGAAYHDDGWIFASERGTQMGHRNLNRWFTKVLNWAGLDNIRIHDLRHTAITDWIASGADPKSAQNLAGHSSPQTTMRIYAKSRQENERAAIEALEKRRSRNA